MGYHRFLESDHKFCHESYSLDNNKEFDFAPTPLFGADVLNQIEGYAIAFGKKAEDTSGKRKGMIILTSQRSGRRKVYCFYYLIGRTFSYIIIMMSCTFKKIYVTMCLIYYLISKEK